MKTYYEQAVEAAEKMRQATPGTPARQGWRDEVVALSALWQAQKMDPEFFRAPDETPPPLVPRRVFDTGRYLMAVVAEFGVPEPIDVRVLNDGRVLLRRPDDIGKDWTTAFDPDELDVEGDIPEDEPLVEVPVAPAEVIEEAEADELTSDETRAVEEALWEDFAENGAAAKMDVTAARAAVKKGKKK